MGFYVSKQTSQHKFVYAGRAIVAYYRTGDGMGGRYYYYVFDNRGFVLDSHDTISDFWENWLRYKGAPMIEHYSTMTEEQQETSMFSYLKTGESYVKNTLQRASESEQYVHDNNFRYIQDPDGTMHILEQIYNPETETYRYDYVSNGFYIIRINYEIEGGQEKIVNFNEYPASSFVYNPDHEGSNYASLYDTGKILYTDETLAKMNMEAGDGTNVPIEQSTIPETGEPSSTINPLYFNFPIGSSDDAIRAASNWINDLEVIAEIDQTNMGKIAAALNQVWNPSGANMTDAILLVARSILQKNLAEGILSIKMIAIPAQASLPYKSPTRLLFNPLGIGAVEGHPIDHFHKYSLGSMKINPLFNDYKDFLCDYSIYLPFAGIYRLDPSIIVDTTLTIMCDIDFITGSILYHIIVDDTVTQRDIYAFSGNCCIEFPITATDYSEKATALTNAIFGVAEAGAGIAAGGAGAGLVVSGVMKGLNAAMPAQPHYVQSSKLIPNSAMLSVLYPYLIISKPIDKTPEHLVDIKGLPTHKVLSLDEVSGYCVIQDIDIENIAYATSNEIDEIKSLLQAGAYF